MEIIMRQIAGLPLSWVKAMSTGMAIFSAIILSYSYPVLAVDSNSVESGNTANIKSLTSVKSNTDSGVSSHTVVVGDTLWNVTFRLRPEGIPMAQAMDILYESNPKAFLDGDSTKLIEGSIVTFPSDIAEVEKNNEITVSQENATLIIPTFEVAEDISVDLEVSSEVVEEAIKETIPDTAEVDQPSDVAPDLLPALEAEDSTEALVDSVESYESNMGVIEPDATVSQSINPPSSKISESKPFSTEQFKTFLNEFDSTDFYQLVSKVKQLPIDFWVFAGAFLFAIIINRSRKSGQVNKENVESTNAQKPIETVLEGPFADSSGDDVFTDSTDNCKISGETHREPKVELEEASAINLPGVEELDAQMREDQDQGSYAGKVLDIDFEEDTIEIDPLQIKLDMASLCIEMGDIESAQAILEEIIGEADKSGKAKAREILDSIET
jgi:FimV-like protein